MPMRVRIDEAGNNQLEKLDKTVVRTFDPRDEHSPIYKKPLRDVFNCLAKQKNKSKKAQKKQKLPNGIYPETLRHTRSYLIARLPGLYADNIGGWPFSTHRFLIDENLPSTLSIDLWRNFGRATHTNFEDLNGKKDDKVWSWASGNSISAIITRDRRMSDQNDLGLIAVKRAHDLLRKRKKITYPVEMPHQPLLIQIDSKSRKSVLSLMRIHKEDIMKHLERRTVPYVFLTDTHCITGPSYTDIAKYDWTTIKQMASDIIGKTKTRPQTSPSASPS